MPTALPAPGVPDDGIKQADCARPMAVVVANAYSAPHPAEESPVVEESVPAHAQPGLLAPAGASAPCTTGLVILSQKRVDPEVVMPTPLQGEHAGCLARGCTLLPLLFTPRSPTTAHTRTVMPMHIRSPPSAYPQAFVIAIDAIWPYVCIPLDITDVRPRQAHKERNALGR